MQLSSVALLAVMASTVAAQEWVPLDFGMSLGLGRYIGRLRYIKGTECEAPCTAWFADNVSYCDGPDIQKATECANCIAVYNHVNEIDPVGDIEWEGVTILANEFMDNYRNIFCAATSSISIASVASTASVSSTDPSPVPSPGPSSSVPAPPTVVTSTVIIPGSSTPSVIVIVQPQPQPQPQPNNPAPAPAVGTTPKASSSSVAKPVASAPVAVVPVSSAKTQAAVGTLALLGSLALGAFVLV
eukprot:GHVU01068379.1.p1 GENE.GHVU01068379.1~~GHVU01068379.1.p1  ORF type:complete len:243 (+),score=33.01 GHVU01068379.1:57-785(+)